MTILLLPKFCEMICLADIGLHACVNAVNEFGSYKSSTGNL